VHAASGDVTSLVREFLLPLGTHIDFELLSEGDRLIKYGVVGQYNTQPVSPKSLYSTSVAFCFVSVYSYHIQKSKLALSSMRCFFRFISIHCTKAEFASFVCWGDGHLIDNLHSI